MPAIFLSHASRDDALASSLETWLVSQGFDDLFIDHTSIRAGDRWREELRRAKASCRVVLCLVTPAWLGSDECYAEFRAAWYMGRRIIPLFCLTGARLGEPQASHLRHVQSEDQGCDLTRAGAPDALNLDAPASEAIAEALRAGLRAGGALARVGVDPLAFDVDRTGRKEPFPGLESFGDEDADAALFFGRSHEISQCLEDLRQMRASPERRAYAVLGASGSGKSSLMKAGLLPRLRRERGWLVLRAFRPGSEPLLSFAEAIAASAGAPSGSHGVIRDRLLHAWSSGGDLRAALDAEIRPLKLATHNPDATVLIPLDQAEELARAPLGNADGADALGDFLRAAVLASDEGSDGPAPYLVVLTVRSDSFAELQRSSRFEGVLTQTADIRALPVHRFAEAIALPAERYGVEVDPALVEILIEDAGGRDSLPLLAFTLQRLWRQYRSEARIVPANYESIGKLSGLIESAAERALRGFDPASVNRGIEGKLPADLDRRGARVFVPALAQVTEQGALARRVAKLADFDAAGRALIDSFDRWRLVVTTRDEAEVAHEAMLREWPRLRAWLVPERLRLETLREVEGAAAAWVSRGRKYVDLIHFGRRLRAIQALRKHPEFRLQIEHNRDVADYIEACSTTRNAWVVAGQVSLGLFVFGMLWSLLLNAVSWVVDGRTNGLFLFGSFAMLFYVLMFGFVPVTAASWLGSTPPRTTRRSDLITIGLAVVAAAVFEVWIYGVFLYLFQGHSLDAVGAQMDAGFVQGMGASTSTTNPGSTMVLEFVYSNLPSAKAMGLAAMLIPTFYAPFVFAFSWLLTQMTWSIVRPFYALAARALGRSSTAAAVVSALRGLIPPALQRR